MTSSPLETVGSKRWNQSTSYFRILKHRRRDIPAITALPGFGFEGCSLARSQAWQAALSRAVIGSNQQRAFVEVFAAENGSTEFRADESAGITRERLALLGPRCGIAPATPPRELTLDQIVGLYRAFFDHVLAAIGGSASLENVGHELAGAALADTLFDRENPAPVETIQRAVNRLRGVPIQEDGVFGEKTFAAFCALAIDRGALNQLLDGIAKERMPAPEDDERYQGYREYLTRIVHFRFAEVHDGTEELDRLMLGRPHLEVVAKTYWNRLRRLAGQRP